MGIHYLPYNCPPPPPPTCLLNYKPFLHQDTKPLESHSSHFVTGGHQKEFINKIFLNEKLILSLQVTFHAAFLFVYMVGFEVDWRNVCVPTSLNV
jgi:hypothetical protein